MSDRLYIYVKDWDTHQPRSDKPNLPWIRLQTALLGDDAWLDLEPADSKLLVTIWLLSQRYGHGRVKANLTWLQSQANLPLSNRYRGLERLVEAGLITLSSTQAPHKRPTKGGLEEKRDYVSLRREENAREDAAKNGVPPAQKWSLADLERMADEAGFHP
jgi:hypothetical protein